MRFDLFVSRPDVYLYNIVVVGEERQAGGIGRNAFTNAKSRTI